MGHRAVPRLAVVGAGLMGRGIASVASAAGWPVVLYDADASAARWAAGRVVGVTVAADLAETVTDADLVIEAITEDLPAKRALFAEMDALNAHALLATNTSVIPVSRIAEGTTRPERVVGTHWWNPPELIPVVEVVRGARTSDAAMDRAEEVVAALGKSPVRVERDVPGFVGNRLQHALWREAIALVEEGVADAKTVDFVVRNTIGLRLAAMGPIENADYVGLDLTLAIHDVVLSGLSRATEPSPLLRRHVAAGRLGAKSAEGFLAWPPGAREEAAGRLAANVARELASRS